MAAEPRRARQRDLRLTFVSVPSTPPAPRPAPFTRRRPPHKSRTTLLAAARGAITVHVALKRRGSAAWHPRGAQPHFMAIMVSTPCCPRKISRMKLRTAYITTGLMSTPKSGGVNPRTSLQKGSVGLPHGTSRSEGAPALLLVTYLRRDTAAQPGAGNHGQDMTRTSGGFDQATMLCGALFRSMLGYQVSGIRRKKNSENTARPMSRLDRTGSSHSGAAALATVGTIAMASAADAANCGAGDF